jgi:CHAT domain-containing protein
MRLLAIGDPLLPAVPSSFTSDFAVRGAYVAKVLDIPPVPPKQDSAFAKELRSVAALFPRNRTKVLTGAAATKQELASLDLRQFNMLLFSTHGYLGKQFSISIGPSLELTESGAANSRFLTASEVAKFQLDADLVVLSACDTSGSDGFADSEGFSGLTSAFLLAGARDVIATLWPVETETTKELITDTLRYRVQDNHSVSKALQRAAIDMINSDKAWQRHPAFWAPFLVVGK